MARVEKSILDVFREGLFWRALGRSAADNPYSPDSINYGIWFQGWSFIDDFDDYVPPNAGIPFDEGL